MSVAQAFALRRVRGATAQRVFFLFRAPFFFVREAQCCCISPGGRCRELWSMSGLRTTASFYRCYRNAPPSGAISWSNMPQENVRIILREAVVLVGGAHSSGSFVGANAVFFIPISGGGSRFLRRICSGLSARLKAAVLVIVQRGERGLRADRPRLPRA